MRRVFGVLAASLAALAFAAPRDASALTLPDGFSTTELAAGLDGPTALAYAPDGRLFIAEKAGRIRVVSADGWLQPRPVIDIGDHVNTYLDRGLLGIALDAGFATNHYLYLLYVHEANPLDPSGPKASRLTRVTVTSDNRVQNPDAPETTVLGSVGTEPCPAPADTVDCIPADGQSHSIGTVRADPDGTLWLGSGDASVFYGADPKALRTYDERSFVGKLIHVDRAGRGLPGHPFCPGDTDLTKVCTKLYAKGFRNPFRFQLRPGAGPLVGDVGWESREEIDLTEPGKSYGWPCYEGTRRTPLYQDMARCVTEYDRGPSAHQLPAYEYPHSGNAAIVAGPHYEATRYPAAYRGAWFFGDYAVGKLWSMQVDGQAVSGVTQFATGFEGGVDLERAPNGDLIYASFGDDAGAGSVQQIVYGDHAPTAQASATPAQGVPPLTVTLSAAGSADVDGDPLSYEWDLDGDGSPDATGASVRHTYPAGVHRATVKVRDDHGLAASATVEVLANESPPTATILAPAAGSRFRIGRPITLRGSGTDAQDGTLGDAALHWRITLHHGNHTHLIEADRSGREISFTPPADHDAGSYLEFRLTAQDSAGLTGSVVRTMQPETITLRLDSSPPGAVLSYAGIDATAPAVRPAAIGFHSAVSAPAALTSGGAQYVFDRWSDGGARLHDVVIPDRDTTLTAIYRLVPGLVPPLGAVLGFERSAPLAAAPRIALDGPATRHPARRLRGHVVGASGRPRVDVALRLRRAHRGCRWWRRPLRRLSAGAARCGRPLWMRAVVDRSGRWQLDLRGRPRRGRYVVLMRARTAAARPQPIAQATAKVRIS